MEKRVTLSQSFKANKMSRDSTIRKMKGVFHARKCLAYPFSYIGRDDYGCDYALEQIRRDILVEKEEDKAGEGCFPHNIQEFFWIRPGCNEGDSWVACGVLVHGSYFFFTGGCDYTGFDCQGGMNLWVSNSWKNIVEHAMPQGLYDLYVDQTEVPPKEGEEPWPEMTEEEFWAEHRRHIRCYECGEKGATFEMPYMDGNMLCFCCYESYMTDRGSRWEDEEEDALQVEQTAVTASGVN
jgi:hypothetical protein